MSVVTGPHKMSLFFPVMHFCAIFTYNFRGEFPNHLLQLGTTLYFIMHVDILPNSFPSSIQHPMGDFHLVSYTI